LLFSFKWFEQARGSGRQPGEFSFDPLGFAKVLFVHFHFKNILHRDIYYQSPKARARYATSEVKNGRTAMLAFAGIVTQAALFPEKSFPFF
jgi:hypothetical protein